MRLNSCASVKSLPIAINELFAVERGNGPTAFLAFVHVYAVTFRLMKSR